MQIVGEPSRRILADGDGDQPPSSLGHAEVGGVHDPMADLVAAVAQPGAQIIPTGIVHQSGHVFNQHGFGKQRPGEPPDLRHQVVAGVVAPPRPERREPLTGRARGQKGQVAPGEAEGLPQLFGGDVLDVLGQDSDAPMVGLKRPHGVGVVLDGGQDAEAGSRQALRGPARAGEQIHRRQRPGWH